MIKLDHEAEVSIREDLPWADDIVLLIEAVDELASAFDTRRETLIGALIEILRRRTVVERLKTRGKDGSIGAER